MRQIKFRAWEKQIPGFSGKMHYDITQYLNDWLHSNDYEVMQFTGLLDKNGKEIYEGDILFCEKSKSRMPSRGTLRKKDPKQISAYIKVVWEDGGFQFEFVRPIDEHAKSYEEKKYTYAYYHFSIWDGQADQPHVEIIGNIYENPELLNT